LLCILQKTNGEVKLGFNGDLYPSAGASVVMTTSGDMVKYQSGARARLGIGSANQILQVKSSLPSWETVDLADTVLTTAGDVLYENATPELARLPKGTQYNNLQMGASLPAWSASSTSTLTGTGDVLYSSGANTLARLAIGSDDEVLTLASGLPTWASAGGGGLDPVFYSSVDFAKGAAQTRYFPLDGSDSNNVGIEDEVEQEQDAEVTIVMMHVVCLAAPSSDSKVTLRDDGADSTQITVTASTTGDFTTGTTQVNWQMIAAGSGTFQATTRALEGT